MESIIKQVQSPEWWFTVVIVGLFVGIAATYAKDWLSRLLSTVSVRFRAYAQRRDAKTRRQIELLLNSPVLLVVEYIRAVLRLFATITLSGSAFLLPAWNVLSKSFPEVDVTTSLLGVPPPSDALSPIISLLLMIAGLISWIAFLRTFHLCDVVRSKLMNEEA